MNKSTHILTRILVLLLFLQGPLAQAMLCADHVSDHDANETRVLRAHSMPAEASIMGDCHTAITGIIAEAPAKSGPGPDAGQDRSCCDAGCACAVTLSALVSDLAAQSASRIQPISIARIGEREDHISVTIRPPIQ